MDPEEDHADEDVTAKEFLLKTAARSLDSALKGGAVMSQGGQGSRYTYSCDIASAVWSGAQGDKKKPKKDSKKGGDKKKKKGKSKKKMTSSDWFASLSVAVSQKCA